eukprot:gene18-57_t
MDPCSSKSMPRPRRARSRHTALAAFALSSFTTVFGDTQADISASMDNMKVNMEQNSFKITLTDNSDADNPVSHNFLVQDSDAANPPEVFSLYSMVNYSLSMTFANDAQPISITYGQLRIVTGDIDAGTQQSKCTDFNHWKSGTHLGGAWASGTAVANIGTDEPEVTSDAVLTFRQGGVYRICFDMLNTFSPGLVTGNVMHVAGVYDNSATCTGYNCLGDTFYKCYLLKGAANTLGSCKLNWGSDDNTKGHYGPNGMVTWSAQFDDIVFTTEGDATNTDAAKASCGGEPAPFLCQANAEDCTQGGHYITPDGSLTTIPTTRADLGSSTGMYNFGAKTVQICYCPGFAKEEPSCNAADEFLQEIGKIVFFATGVIDARATTLKDITLHRGAAVSHPFRLHVDIPYTLAPTNSNANRVIITARNSALNDLPSWDDNHGCRIAEHSSYFVSPDNSCARGVGNQPLCQVDGGTARDVKLFGDVNVGFSYFKGDTEPQQLNFYTTQDFDICMCLDNCIDAVNWFKVGQMAIVPFRPVSAASGTQDLFTQYVSTTGTIGFWRPTDVEQDSLGLAEGSMIKLIQDNTRTATNEQCKQPYQDSTDALVQGMNSQNAGVDFVCKQNPMLPDEIDKQKLVCNNGQIGRNQITIVRAGIMALCYCAKISASGECLHEDYWTMVMHWTVRGPTSTKLQFSTDINVAFTIEGFGLAATNRIRILKADAGESSCKGDPALSEETILVGCPGACTPMTNKDGQRASTDIVLFVKDSSHVDCDAQGQNCKNVFIETITVFNSTHTKLVFAEPLATGAPSGPGLETGDYITIEKNFQCNANDQVCTDEHLAVVQGRMVFADKDYDANDAASYLMNAHQVTKEDDMTYYIPVGWSAPAPKFSIIWDAVNAQYATWTQTNKATTKQEIRATVEKSDLVLCWSAERTNEFVQPMGLISFVNPSMMRDTMLSLTTKRINSIAPVIISFKTATPSGDAGRQYQEGNGIMQIKILLSSVATFDIHQSDKSALEENALENSFMVANQAICGKLFTEVWSSDVSRGFPTPKGCYHAQSGTAREIYIVFNYKNGLAPDTSYQLVMMGEYKSNTVTDPQVQVFVQADVVTEPYAAIELGTALLNDARLPVQEVGADPAPVPAADAALSDALFGTSGVRLTGGIDVDDNPSTASILALEAGNALMFEVSGHYSGAILGSAIMRIFLWPLTQWDTGAVCTARGMESATTGFRFNSRFQSCVGEQVVQGVQTKVVKIVMPSDMDAIRGDIKRAAFALDGLTLPSTGDPPTVLGVEISTSADLRADYVETGGALIYKMPDKKSSIAQLLLMDGNDKPFAEATSNILYMNAILALSLRQIDVTGLGAEMHINLPEGYTCVDASAEVENDLFAFQQISPQVRGFLDPAGWIPTNSNVCRYKVPLYSAIWAGSSIYVKIEVNNPNEPLAQSNPANKWELVVTSKGMAATAVEMDRVTLSGETVQHSGNIAVLASVKDAVIQPTYLKFSTDNSDVHQYIMVFFRAYQNSGQYAHLKLTAPTGYDFTKMHYQSVKPERSTDCTAGPLSDEYYATGADPTNRMPNLLSCSCIAQAAFEDISIEDSDAAAMNRNLALVQTENSFQSKALYAFQIQVKNPIELLATDATTWSIYILGSTLDPIDGIDSVIWDPAHDGSSAFLAYKEALPDHFANVNIASMLPTSMVANQEPTTMSVRFILPKPLTAAAGQLDVLATTSKIHLTTPLGFLFSCGANNVVYPCTPVDNVAFFWDINIADVATRLEGVELVWPGGSPLAKSHILTFNQNVYKAEKQYGFDVLVSIPNRAATMQSNNYYLEFGYDTMDIDTRTFSYVPQADRVRAIVNFGVEYSNNIAEQEPFLIITFETISSIPVNGTIEITPPEGLIFDGICSVEEAEATYDSWQDSLPLPESWTIRSNTMPESEAPCRFQDGKLTLRAQCPWKDNQNACIGGGQDANNYAVLAGLYRLRMKAKNPERAQNVPSSTTPCGFAACWSIDAYEPPELETFEDRRLSSFRVESDGEQRRLADAPARSHLGDSIKSFNINLKMQEAQLMLLDSANDGALRTAINRNDRPGQPNNLIFSFRMNKDSVDANSEMLLRGPSGFIFAEDCLSTMVIAEDQVFGDQKWPSQYDTWEPGVAIRYCIGKGPNVIIGIDPGLMKDRHYVFRIGILKNPMTQPLIPYWSIEFNLESGTPFRTFNLYTFSDVSIVATSQSRAPILAQKERTINYVTIVFTPYNTVSRDIPILGSGAVLRITGPQGFEFVHVEQECNAEVKQNAYIDSDLQSQAEVVWSDQNMACRVQVLQPHVLDLHLISAEVMSAGLEYEMIVGIYNPSGTTYIDQPALEWQLATFASDSTFDDSTALDQVKVTGYTLNQVLNDFQVINRANLVDTTPIYNGDTDIPRLTIVFTSPANLKAGDVVELITPKGFDLADDGSENLCPAHSGNSADPIWMTKKEFRAFIGTPCAKDKICSEGYESPNGLPCGTDMTQMTCTYADGVTTIQFLIGEESAVPKDTEIEFKFDTRNPAKVAEPITSNFWKATHYETTTVAPPTGSPPGTPDQEVLKVIASEVLQGWQIVPQLGNLEVKLIGESKAAGATSTIEVSFEAVSHANKVRLQTPEPTGIDFGEALCLTAGFVIETQSGYTITLQGNIEPFVKTEIRLSKVQLGSGGGQTINHVTTYEDLAQQDEALGVPGFIQPGLLSISAEEKSWQLLSVYKQNPDTYPVKSLWEPHFGEDTSARFEILLTYPPAAGEMLYIESLGDLPYSLKADLKITERQDYSDVPVSSVQYVGPSMAAILDIPLRPETLYIVEVTVMPPVMKPSEQNWLIETRDPGTYGNTLLPSNTNDRAFPGYLLVYKYDFQVLVDRSPPTAIIEIKLIIDPKGSRPTEITLVAPTDFIFPEDCLVDGGGEITSCNPRKAMGGRMTAMLATDEAGLSDNPDRRIVIRAVSPIRTPSSKNWFVRGIEGCLGEPVGWGEASEGFDIVPMKETKVFYAGIPQATTAMVIRFTTTEIMPIGSMIDIQAPPEIALNCEETSFIKLSLPENSECTTVGSKANITVFDSLVPKQYSFSIMANLPPITPRTNFWKIRLFNPEGLVRDADMEIMGRDVYPGFQATAYPIRITAAFGTEPASVTLSFSIDNDLPETIRVGSILIQFPEKHYHLIERQADIIMRGARLPKDADDVGVWIDFKNENRIRLALYNKAGSQQIRSGLYEISFPIMIPAIMPYLNYWTLSFCQGGEEYEQSCFGSPAGVDFSSEAEIATFPLPGLSFLDETLDTIDGQDGSGASPLQMN